MNVITVAPAASVRRLFVVANPAICFIMLAGTSIAGPGGYAADLLWDGNKVSGETSLLQAEIDSIHVWQGEWGPHSCAIPGTWVQPANIYGRFKPGYSYYLADNCKNAGGGLWLTPSCSDGSAIIVINGVFECEGKKLLITSTSPFIPGGSGVENNHVMTADLLDLQVTEGGAAVAGVTPSLQSDRGAIDQINVFGATNSAGSTDALVYTRDQNGASTITSALPDIKTGRVGVIQWLPAQYEETFLVTCYGVAQESSDTTGPMITIPGLPGEYHESFYKDIVRQGSGIVTNNGQFPYIQRDWSQKTKSYKYFKCPHTTNGDCATAGSSIAVDPSVIPMSRRDDVYSRVSISGVGERTSDDGGDWVKQYHIDLFYGRTVADYKACLAWGRGNGPHEVTFENYVH